MRTISVAGALLLAGCSGPARVTGVQVFGGALVASGASSVVTGGVVTGLAAEAPEGPVGAGIGMMVGGLVVALIGVAVINAGSGAEPEASDRVLRARWEAVQRKADRAPPGDRAPSGVIHPDARIEPARTSTVPVRRPL